QPRRGAPERTKVATISSLVSRFRPQSAPGPLLHAIRRKSGSQSGLHGVPALRHNHPRVTGFTGFRVPATGPRSGEPVRLDLELVLAVLPDHAATASWPKRNTPPVVQSRSSTTDNFLASATVARLRPRRPATSSAQ